MIQWRNFLVRLSRKCWIYRAVVLFYILVYNPLPHTLILIIFSGLYKLILFSFQSKVWTRFHYRPKMNTLLIIALSLFAAGKKILNSFSFTMSNFYLWFVYGHKEHILWFLHFSFGEVSCWLGSLQW